ncbi:zinc ABC transporter substrate-binding protein [Mycobacterium sp. ACS4331]|uniref:metal ABC transporter solute-binding protein, Zn/Mn family n=1 Tax=Mycobacterium sp. ACS4331 TaxID=1834121 RepID=UPI0007FB770C|nr:zinc ABC transporter substrate-binding protein [Mycobacterium sp. ACS4331]OBF16592.1 ABC transporter substrate-binding protein [Mycobacterium sp. ACS4331]
MTSCSGEGPATETADSAACPTTPVNVVVSVDQWGGIVSQLGGDCARVTTVVASSSVDPHDYEPSPADAAKFGDAQLVVLNGGHYDEWAEKLAQTSAPTAAVVDIVEADHARNPHAWYDPAAVVEAADTITAKLTELAPDARDHFAARRADFAEALQPYEAAIAAIKAGAQGRGYAATEGVFDPMAQALGLQNRTPAGYQAAATNHADPAPADLDAFLTLLSDKGVDVLIFNTQTEGAVPAKLRAAAEAAGIPVVNVTETVAPGSDSFEAWQVNQLTALAEALGVSV